MFNFRILITSHEKRLLLPNITLEQLRIYKGYGMYINLRSILTKALLK